MAAYTKHKSQVIPNDSKNLRETFYQCYPNLQGGTFYFGALYSDTSFGFWFAQELGDKSAFFVYMKDGECMTHPILLESIADEFLRNARSFYTSRCTLSVETKELMLYPDVKVRFSFKVLDDRNIGTSRAICPLVFTYASEKIQEDVEPEEIHISKGDTTDFVCDKPQFDNADQLLLCQYITNFWCHNQSHISPDRTMAIIAKNMLKAVVLIHAIDGKVNVYDFVSYEECNEKDEKGDKIPHIHPWIQDYSIVRFSRPIFDGQTATIYHKRHAQNKVGQEKMCYYKFTLELQPEF